MAIILPLCLIMLFACSVDPNVKANELYIEASIQIESAIGDTNSYSSAYKSIDNAHQYIELISSQYAQSNVGMNLISGSLDVSGFTIEHLQKLHDSLEQLALAEQEILLCALLFARSIKDTGERIKSIAKIAKIYAEAGQDSIAFQVLDNIEVEYFKATVIASIASTYADSGRFSDALGLANAIPDPENRAEIFYEIAIRYAEAKKFNEALSTIELIEDNTWKVLALTETSDAYSKNSQDDIATQLLIQSLQIAYTIEDGVYKSLAISEIADKYLKKGNFREAVEIAKAMEVLDARESTLAKIVHKYIEEGQIAVAILLSKEIFGDSKGSIVPAIARKYAQDDQLIEAKKTISSLDFIAQSLVLGSIAEGYVEAGKNKEALNLLPECLRLAEAGDDSLLKLMAITTIAEIYAKAGEFEESINIAENIAAKEYKVIAITLIADEYLKTGQTENANKLNIQSLEVAGQIEDLHDKLWIYGFITDDYIKTGDKTEATKILFKSLATMYSREYLSDRDSTSASISYKFAEIGEVKQALKLVSGINSHEKKAELLIEISQLHAIVGKQLGDNEGIELIKLVQSAKPIGQFW